MREGHRTRVVNMKTASKAVTVRIDRRTKWGNPHKIGFCDVCRIPHDREGAIKAYKKDIQSLGTRQRKEFFMACQDELKGETLGCWCKPEACHGDILAGLAEGKDLGSL